MTHPTAYGVTERTIARSDADAHAERIRLTGVTVIDAGLDPSEVAYLSGRLDEMLDAQARAAGGRERLAAIGEHDTLRCCLAHDEAFVRLASNPHVLAVCQRLLGDYIVLTQQNGIVNRPEDVHTQTAFHRDLPYQHFVSSRPISVSALFCVDRFTRENGATVVLPGTHRIEQFPSPGLTGELETAIEAPPGAFLVFDSMLFHRAGQNTSAQPRRAVNHVYALPFVAQQISLPDALHGRYADDPVLRRLFGYDAMPARSIEAWWERRQRRRP
jgi:ectoine hydroxylase-related dioxygenase (phytanoyl-CoA dioxygenase family)